MLGLVVASLVFGIAMVIYGEEEMQISIEQNDSVQNSAMLDLLKCFLGIVIIIVDWIIFLAPAGVCFLVAGEVFLYTRFFYTL